MIGFGVGQAGKVAWNITQWSWRFAFLLLASSKLARKLVGKGQLELVPDHKVIEPHPVRLH